MYMLCGSSGENLPFSPLFPLQDRKAFHESILDEILEERVPPRLGRRNPRAVKRKIYKWPTRSRQSQSSVHKGIKYEVQILK